MKRTMSGLVALLLVLCNGMSLHAQGIEWEMLNKDAMQLYRQGRYEQGIKAAKKSLQVAEQAVGPDHPSVATSLNILGLVYKTQGQYAQAELLYKRSLAFREKALGPDHPSAAESLENMAALFRKTGRNNEVEALEKRAVMIRAIKR